MLKCRNLVFLFVSLSLIFILAPNSHSQQMDIEKWIEEARVNTQKGAIFNYTYQLEVSFAKKNKLGFGRKFTKTYKAVIPSKFRLNTIYTHPLILVKDSEAVVTQDSIDKAIEVLIKKLERAEKMVEDSSAKEDRDINGGYWTIQFNANKQSVRIDVFKLLEIAQFSNLQTKQVDGNEIISIDFSPYPSLVFDKSINYISDIEGQIWIDPVSRRIIRIEGYPLGNFAQIRDKSDAERKDKAVFLFIQTKVSEGFWFPKYVRLDFTDNPEIFKPIKIEYSFSDYQKNHTGVQRVNIKAPDVDKDQERKSEIEQTYEVKDN